MGLNAFTSLALLLFFVPLLQNCGEKKDGDSESYIKTIEIQRDFLSGHALEFHVEILDTINLEAPGNPDLTGFQDIAFAQDFIVVVDIRQGILKFDQEGNFLHTIGEIGEGPEEYTMPYAIHLDEKENSILVADWIKRVVISYDLEGNFIASSQRLPGRPISLYNENDSLVVIQEGEFDSNTEPRQVLISVIETKTLDAKHPENPLYSYNSSFTIMHRIPRILSRVNEASLFFIPILKVPAEHRNTDTIFRKTEDRLLPEYLLKFTGFNSSDPLLISKLEMFDDYAYLAVGHNMQSHLVVVDLVNKRPLFHTSNLFDREFTLENMPRHKDRDVLYSILRNKEGKEEKNPMIVMYRLTIDLPN
jgi:hypothetical protein